MMDLHCILSKYYLKIYLSIAIGRLKWKNLCENTSKELFISYLTIIHDHLAMEGHKGS